MGSRREADMAGIVPLTRPTSARISSDESYFNSWSRPARKRLESRYKFSFQLKEWDFLGGNFLRGALLMQFFQEFLLRHALVVSQKME
jgi:hypothetical protein